MSVKLTIVYGRPEDPDAFDKHYLDVHMAIVARWPGLQRVEIARVVGGPMGSESPYHLITELHFSDEDALNAALASDAGREAGQDFVQIAPSGSFMTVSELIG